MGYSKLDYKHFMDDYEYWYYVKGVALPLWAKEIADMGYRSVSAIDFYDDVFGDDLEPHRLPDDYRTGEYGAIALEIEHKKNKREVSRKAYRYTVTEGNEELYDLIDRSDNFCVVAPVSYAGRRRTNDNARFMYALCIEVDDIEPKNGLNELFYTFERSEWRLPKPTYIVCSGSGLHLYFCFEKPIPLFKNVFEQLTEIKTYLTKHLWSRYVSKSWQNIQYESICQAFRCVGTYGKNKKRVSMAFKIGEKLTIEQFNAFLPDELKMSVIYKTDLPLAKAKALYPEWYKRRIVQGAPKGHYKRHEGIYHNWVKKILDPINGAQVGHRYNCLENLCSLAVQCNISPEQVEKDCRAVAERFEKLTNSEDNHFGEYDIICALRTYHNASESAYNRRIEFISKKTGIELTPNARNGRKQADHIEYMNNQRAFKVKMGECTNGGRPDVSEIVEQWKIDHPKGTKAECIRDTGLSKPTVYKWWEGKSKIAVQKKEVRYTNSIEDEMREAGLNEEQIERMIAYIQNMK